MFYIKKIAYEKMKNIGYFFVLKVVQAAYILLDYLHVEDIWKY